MAYFSNGTESMDYESQYCDECVHQGGENGPGCMVWILHVLHSYDEANKPDSWLHVLIPRSKDGLTNEQCTMFYAKEKPLATMDPLRDRRLDPIGPCPYGCQNGMLPPELPDSVGSMSRPCPNCKSNTESPCPRCGGHRKIGRLDGSVRDCPDCT